MPAPALPPLGRKSAMNASGNAPRCQPAGRSKRMPGCGLPPGARKPRSRLDRRCQPAAGCDTAGGGAKTTGGGAGCGGGADCAGGAATTGGGGAGCAGGAETSGGGAGTAGGALATGGADGFCGSVGRPPNSTSARTSAAPAATSPAASRPRRCVPAGGRGLTAPCSPVGGGAGAAATGAPPATGAPHWTQNRASATNDAPHCVQNPAITPLPSPPAPRSGGAPAGPARSARRCCPPQAPYRHRPSTPGYAASATRSARRPATTEG